MVMVEVGMEAQWYKPTQKVTRFHYVKLVINVYICGITNGGNEYTYNY